MTVSVIDGYVVSDEGAVIAQGFISENLAHIGWNLKQSLKKICRQRNIPNYRIVPFHHGSEFGMAAIMLPAGNSAVN